MQAVAETIGSQVVESGNRWPGHLALVFPETRLTFASLSERSIWIAKVLIGLGVRAKDHVGLFMVNSSDYVAAICGCSIIGAVAVPISTRFKERELSHVLRSADLKMVLTAQVRSDRITRGHLVLDALAIREQYTGPSGAAGEVTPTVVDIAMEIGRDALGPAVLATMWARVSDTRLCERAASVVKHDPGLIIYTSGTTALPKGAVISHEALMLRAAAFIGRFRLISSDRVWDAKPFFHSGALQALAACIASGARYCSMPFFDSGIALSQIRAEACTVAWPVFETIWSRVLDDRRRRDDDLASLRAVGLVGPAEGLVAAQRRVPNALITSSYGSTECSPVAQSVVDDPESVRLCSVGRPVAGVEVRVVEPETKEVLGVGEVGELVYRAPWSFTGYFGDEEFTRSTVDADGWYASKDLGCITEGGLLQFRGRLKDMLKVGGENVAAVEIEAVLVSHPCVSIAAVVGIPDAEYTEVPVGFVEVRRGVTVDEAELIEFCRTRIASFKVPRQIHFVESWPMSATKIRKSELREAAIQYAASPR